MNSVFLPVLKVYELSIARIGLLPIRIVPKLLISHSALRMATAVTVSSGIWTLTKVISWKSVRLHFEVVDGTAIVTCRVWGSLQHAKQNAFVSGIIRWGFTVEAIFFIGPRKLSHISLSLLLKSDCLVGGNKRLRADMLIVTLAFTLTLALPVNINF